MYLNRSRNSSQTEGKPNDYFPFPNPFDTNDPEYIVALNKLETFVEDSQQYEAEQRSNRRIKKKKHQIISGQLKRASDGTYHVQTSSSGVNLNEKKESSRRVPAENIPASSIDDVKKSIKRGERGTKKSIKVSLCIRSENSGNLKAVGHDGATGSEDAQLQSSESDYDESDSYTESSSELSEDSPLEVTSEVALEYDCGQ